MDRQGKAEPGRQRGLPHLAHQYLALCIGAGRDHPCSVAKNHRWDFHQPPPAVGVDSDRRELDEPADALAVQLAVLRLQQVKRTRNVDL